MNGFFYKMMCAAAALLAMCAAASEARAQTGSVIPIFECIEQVESGAYRGYFGYNNTTGSRQTLIAGSDQNFFSPGASDRGQPSTFLEGENRAAFFAYFNFGDTVQSYSWNLNGGTVTVTPDSTACRPGTITYQGRLTNGGAQATGSYDFQFRLFDAAASGTQIGTTVESSSVAVANGVFTVPLNFGKSALKTPGARFLEISVRAAGASGAYTTLVPRQTLTDTPFAFFAANALSASRADNATNADNAYSLNGAFASDFLRNSAAQQSGNLNLTGNGTFGGTVTAGAAAANKFTARGGAPGANGSGNNGYAFSGTGDNDSGLFSEGNGQVSLYTNAGERVRVTDAGATVNGGLTVTGAINGTAANASNAANLGGVAATNYLQSNGSGANLTNLNASNLTTGTVADTRLSSNVALRNSANTFTGDQTISGNFSQTGAAANLTLTNGFTAFGTFGTGVITAEGAGTRMMFYPGKAAFRAGNISATQWDDANTGNYSTAFGQNTRANADNTFAAGRASVASQISSVALGEGNTASGAASVALGYGAHTNARQGSFVFADRSVPIVYDSNGNVDTTNSDLFRAAVNHSANWRVSGGFRIFTSSNLSTGVTIQSGAATSNWGQSNAVISTSTGAFLSTGGTWTNASSRDLKTNFAAVNTRDILRKVLRLPIQTWNYKAENANIRHIGAISQDFAGSFKVGGDDRAISTVDADGVAFAAIQGLNEELNDRTTRLQNENAQLKQQLAAQNKINAAQNAQLMAFEMRLKRLEKATVKSSRTNTRKNKRN